MRPRLCGHNLVGMRFFSISLFTLAVIAACGGSDTPSPGSTGTPASDGGRQDGVARPAFRLEYDNQTNLANWDEVEDAESYKLQGEAIWWPDCEDWGAGLTEPQTVPIAETVPAETSEFALPRPDDERYTRLKDFTLQVTALDGSGNTVGYNNTGQITEPTCETYVP